MSGPVISADWIGRVIDGRFALLEWLGGSINTGLFRTELQQPITKRAAIKLIVASGNEADALLAGWAKVAYLSHPRLTQVFRSGRFQFGAIGLVYVVTECADEILAQILPERSLTTDETREMLGPVIDALQYLHGKGFVHAHLKPSNILVVNDRLKISGEDAVGAGGMRNRFQPLGAYEAPELADGPIVPSVDVWALGVTLIEVLTQRPPSWDRALSRDPMVPEEMPRAFAEIARECLRRNPEQRWTLSEIKAHLEPSQPIEFPAGKAEKAIPAAVDPVRSEKMLEATELTRAPSRMHLLPLLAALILVIAVLALLVLRDHPKENAGTSGQAPSAATEGTTTESSGSSPAPRAQPGAAAKGRVEQRVMPKVTSSARATIHGTVLVAVRVTADASGRVTQATLNSAASSKYFAKAAIDAARGWRFKAAQNGGPAASVWTLRFRFRRTGDEASAVEETR